MAAIIDQKILLRQIEQSGLTLWGAFDRTTAESILAEAAEHLASWQQAGYAGEMRYMERDLGLYRSFDSILGDAESALIFLIPYCPTHPDVGEEAVKGPQFGRVARYAWGRDYHQVIRAKLESFISSVSDALCPSTPIRWRAFTDSVPILERSLAAGIGHGFIGRNSMLIRPGLGSYTFIAEVLWNLKLDTFCPGKIRGRIKRNPNGPTQSPLTPGSGCGNCKRCAPYCPTAAIVEDGVINANRCISYLTIEKRNNFTREEQEQIGNWVFGCDLCQEICPFNSAPKDSSPWKEFLPSPAVGPHLDLIELLEMRTKDHFTSRFNDTALMRCGRESLLRNACAVLANNNCLEAVNPLLEVITNPGPEPSNLIEDSARTALFRLKQITNSTQSKQIERILQS